MKLHIESVQQKLEDSEKERLKFETLANQENSEIRREKRRMDELLTLKETEVEKLK
jgi:hypothetical protein